MPCACAHGDCCAVHLSWWCGGAGPISEVALVRCITVEQALMALLVLRRFPVWWMLWGRCRVLPLAAFEALRNDNTIAHNT